MKSKIVLVLFFLLNVSQAQNNLFRYISLENAEVLSNGMLKDGEWSYRTAISGNSTNPIIYSEAFAGTKSLLFSTPAGQSKQRFEYKLCDYDEPNALGFYNERFVGFAVKIPNDFDPLEASVIFFQAWQGSPWGPPIMLKVTSGSNPYIVRLTIRNSQTGPNSETADEKLWADYMYKNQWYTFVIGMKPRVYGDSSSIQLWMNNQKVLDWKNKGNIGYDPGTFETNAPLPSLCLKFGIYQPGINSAHTLLFDEIRLADNYNSAVPIKTVGVINCEELIPSQIMLHQNYPNPFNSTTSIIFELPISNNVTLSIFNIYGELIKTLVNGQMSSGKHEVQWHTPENISTGVYFYRIKVGEYSAVKKLLLIK